MLPIQNKYRVAYAGHYKDPMKILQSSSGGAASAIAEAVIHSGGCVFGVTYTNDYKCAEYYIATTAAQLERLKGSKYIEVKKQVLINGEYTSIYPAVKAQLRSGKPVLFIGLGCTIAALRTYIKANQIDDELLYTVSLICHGQPPSEIANQYISQLETRFSGKIRSFNTRYKRNKWTPIYIRAEFESDIVYETPLYCSDFGYAFSIYSREACYQCRYRGNHHPSDIVVGDFWGITEKIPGYNQHGVSLIIPQTEKGQQLLSTIDTNSFLLYQTNFQYAIDNNPMYWRSRPKHKKYEQFKRVYREKGLHAAVVSCQGRIPYLIRTVRNNILYRRTKHL